MAAACLLATTTSGPARAADPLPPLRPVVGAGTVEQKKVKAFPWAEGTLTITNTVRVSPASVPAGGKLTVTAGGSITIPA